MSEYGGLTPTGRELREPAATLVELANDEGALFTGLRYDEVYRGHQALGVGIELIRSFLEYPMVIGLAEMRWADTSNGVFVFDTGPIWTLTEVLRRHRDIGQTVGVRAGIELAYLAAQILHEAGEQGPREGCYSHGNLTPWRVTLRADGSVQIFGYGLPPVEWLCHRDDPNFVLDADSVRYAPPERLAVDAEDPAADSYALVLIVWEMITGEPLMAGHDLPKLKEEIGLAKAQQLVSKSKIKGLPASVRDLLARALIFDPDTRVTGQQLMDGLAEALQGKLPGDSLADVIQRLRGKARETPKGRKVQKVAGTSVFTPQELAEMAEQDEEQVEDVEETRWGKSSRRKKPASETEDDAPSRRRRRAPDADETAASEEEAPKRRRRRKEPEPEPSADEPPKRRRRRSAADDADAPAAEEAKPARRRRRTAEPASKPAVEEAAEAPPKRRRRRAPEAEPEASPPSDPEEPAVEPAPRRKRRSAKDAPSAPEPKVEAAPEATKDPKADDEAAPRRRRRRTEPKPEPEPEAAKADEEPARRRRRRTEPAETPEAKDSEADDKPAPRRRRRRSE